MKLDEWSCGSQVILATPRGFQGDVSSISLIKLIKRLHLYINKLLLGISEQAPTK